MAVVLNLNAQVAVRRTRVQNRAVESGSIPEAVAADWHSFIRRMAAGDQSGMQDFYERTNHLVFGLVLRIVRDRSLAEDVTVEVYAQVWRDAATYDQTRGAPVAWLLTVARSRAIDLIRSRRRDENTDPLEAVGDLRSEAPDPETTTAEAERGRFVRGAIALLVPEQREAIEMAFFAGLSHSEIAERLDQPLGTVKTRIRIGMLKLREMLDHLNQQSLALREG